MVPSPGRLVWVIVNDVWTSPGTFWMPLSLNVLQGRGPIAHLQVVMPAMRSVDIPRAGSNLAKPSSSSLYAESKSFITPLFVSGGRAGGRERNQTRTGFGVKSYVPRSPPPKCLGSVRLPMYMSECQKVDITRFRCQSMCCRERRKEGWIFNNTTAPMNVWVSTLRRLDCRAYPRLRRLRECLVSPLGSAAPSVVVPSRTPDLGLVTYGSVETSKGRKIQTSAIQLSA